tara:strand:+ start:468 stop:809 length:342 start_codon:yes stop_codon:yes gene_type:complete
MRNGLSLKEGVTCEDKVELGHMTEEDYETGCKFIPGNDDSRFPQEVIEHFAKEDINEGNVDHSKKDIDPSTDTPNTLAWWQEPGDVRSVSWDQQTLDPILLALNSKVSVKRSD